MSSKYITKTQREVLSKIPYPSDKVIVKNLSLTANAGYDSWGREKTQPVLITTTLTLKKPFDSAAASDTVDSSTVHYGKLSKKMMAVVGDHSSKWLPTYELAHLLNQAANEVAEDGLLAACEIEIRYPKASMLGDGAGFIHCFNHESEVSHTVFLNNVKIPCLIGVNDHERRRRQQVVVNLWIDHTGPEPGDSYTEIETVLTEIIEKSSFETLESLVSKVDVDLRERLAHILTRQSTLRLRADKPVAVPFADAPAIEIVRNG